MVDTPYYSIGEVSDQVGLEPHVLRYWEQEFEALAPEKNRAGRRVYTPDDVAIVERIQHLLKDEMYTIAGARQRMERDAAEREQEAQLRADLKRMRAFLGNVLDGLDAPSSSDDVS